jgi:hypothetical protein
VAQANAAMAMQNGHAEAAAFAGVKARLGLTNDELLRCRRMHAQLYPLRRLPRVAAMALPNWFQLG